MPLTWGTINKSRVWLAEDDREMGCETLGPGVNSGPGSKGHENLHKSLFLEPQFPHLSSREKSSSAKSKSGISTQGKHSEWKRR